MSGSVILDVGRCIMAVLQPITGTRAGGNIYLKTAPGKTAVLPPFVYLSPVLSGQLRNDMLFKTLKNPATLDGSWPIVETGSVIPIVSNIGGARFNLPAGTKLRIEPDSDAGDLPLEVTTRADFTGGTDDNSDIGIANIGTYESFGSLPNQQAFQAAVGGRFPVVIVTWNDSEPADGMATSSVNRNTQRGSSSLQLTEEFTLWLVCPREDSEPARRGQAMRMLDRMASLLVERRSVDEQGFSSPGGLQIRKRWRSDGNEALFKAFRVYMIAVAATVTITQEDRRTYSPLLSFVTDWLKEDEVLSSGGVLVRDDLPMIDDLKIRNSVP
jgi:hypothetical protein